MNHYVYIKHPITGDKIIAIPTGKTRQGQPPNSQAEAEVRVLTPGTNLTTLWITKEDFGDNPEQKEYKVV